MLDKLSNVISSFSTTTRTNVNSLIRETKVSKTEIQNLISNLKNFSSGSAFATNNVAPFSPLDRALLVDLFRDSYFRIQRFFTAMNSVGLALNSMINVLDSEINKVQKDIDSFEFFINNYNFLVGEDDLYNLNYLEKFNNLLNDYRYDGANFLIPDRDDTPFPIGGNGFVDSSAGIFKFGSSVEFINILNNIQSISVQSNYGNYITSSSDIKNIFNETLLDSWNVTIKSPIILTSNLTDYSKYINYNYSSINGAQTIVELNLIQSVIMDTVRFNPNFGSNFELLQISINDIDNNLSNLLNSPIKVSGLREFSFSRRAVNKIIFIFNQPTYTRNKMTPISSEQNFKAVNSFVNDRVNFRKNQFSKYQDLVYWFFRKKTNVQNIATNKTEYDFYTYKFPVEKDYFRQLVEEEIFINSNIDIEYKYDYENSPIILNLIENMFRNLVRDNSLIKTSYYVESNTSSSQKLLSNNGFVKDGKSNAQFSIKNQFFNYPIVSDGVQDAVKSLLNEEIKDFYEYQISLRSIDFLNTKDDKVTKACFVSKKIPVDGQVLGLKAKIDILEENLNILIKNYDLKNLISYELSVSNAEEADSENDWYPVSFNNQRVVDSEVAFFDITNMSYQLRFIPIVDSIFLYKDGMMCDPYKYTYSIQTNKLSLLDTSLFSPSSVFCVRYSLDLVRYNPAEIDFVKQNILNDDVKAYTTSEGSGQTFNRADGSNSVIIEKVPYINQNLLQSAVYSSSLGTIFSANTGYSPVKIRLSNGTFAVNLTNYTKTVQNVRFYDTNTVLFIQNGRNIVFNQQINSPFTVFYDYSPNTLRFRLIARRNIPNVQIPIKIDNVLLKMKTLSYNEYNSKFNMSFIGN